MIGVQRVSVQAYCHRQAEGLLDHSHELGHERRGEHPLSGRREAMQLAQPRLDHVSAPHLRVVTGGLDGLVVTNHFRSRKHSLANA